MKSYFKEAVVAGAFLATAFLSGGAVAGEDLFASPAVAADELAVRAMGANGLAVVHDVDVEDNEVDARGSFNRNNVSGNAFRNAAGVIINVQNNGHANAISVPVGISVSITP